MKKLLGAAAVVATLFVAWAPAASAAPEASKPTVKQCGDDCSETSDVTEGDPVAGRLRFTVSGASNVGLSAVRLEARRGSGSWVCFRQWSTGGAFTFTASTEWVTARWPGTSSTPPSGCSANSAHGDRTSNGTYQVRVVSVERYTNDEATSSAFGFGLANDPATPEWAAGPVVVGDTDGQPLVELRWRAIADPDVQEYHYLRRGPDGTVDEFAVSASKPGGQGCELSGDIYTCYDDYFPANGYSGSYSYVLVAYRSSPDGTSCSLPPGGKCTTSQSSAQEGATLRPKAPPTPTPTPTKTTGGSGGSTTGTTGAAAQPKKRGPSRVLANNDYRDFYTGTYEKTLPFGSRRSFSTVPSTDGSFAAGGETPTAAAAPGDAASDERTIWLSIAAGLAMLMVAGHLKRLLRDS